MNRHTPEQAAILALLARVKSLESQVRGLQRVVTGIKFVPGADAAEAAQARRLTARPPAKLDRRP